MKRWIIIYSDGAKNDILGITDYISQASTMNAEKVLDRLEHCIGTLSTLPERGRVVP